MNKFKKWFSPAPIWSNPIGWSCGVGRSRARVITFIIIHIAFITFGLWSIYVLTRLLQKDDFTDQLSWMSAVLVGAMPIFFIGVFYPTLYLYAIYRLLQEIDKRDKDKVTGQSSPV
jgi:hypothetical protein